MQSNAQVALVAASRIHQRVAAGGGISSPSTSYTTYEGPVKDFHSTAEQVIATADKFLEWLDAADAL